MIYYGRVAREELTSSGVDIEDVGERQLKFNHSQCGDTRSRLYVKREGEVVLGWCHNCSNGYHLVTKNILGLGREETIHSPVRNIGKFSWEKSSSDTEVWSVEALTRLEMYECLDEDFIRMYNYRYSPETNILWYKAADNYIGRYLANPHGNVRYYAQRGASIPYYKGVAGRKTLFLCEDGLSAQKVNFYAGHPTAALLSTSLPTNVGDFVRTIKEDGVTDILVWLDADEAGRKAANNLVKELRPLIDTLNVVGLVEPKEFPRAIMEDWA